MQVVSLDDAIRILRDDPRYRDLVRDAYLGEDVLDSAQRFMRSSEFEAVKDILGTRIKDATILDLGAGIGVASYAFLNSGARHSYTLEPDRSDLVGIGAMKKVISGLSADIIQAFGEHIPLQDQTIDIYYARQVLHHTQDLKQVMKEAYRVLKPGGVMLACREHVIRTEQDLAIFLANHPVHQLAGGENAYRLDEYKDAITASGLRLVRVFAQYDTLINTFPAFRTVQELHAYPDLILRRRFGALGDILAKVPLIKSIVWARIKRHIPGNMYTFYAVKPG